MTKMIETMKDFSGLMELKSDLKPKRGTTVVFPVFQREQEMELHQVQWRTDEVRISLANNNSEQINTFYRHRKCCVFETPITKHVQVWAIFQSLSSHKWA